jgi:hypothetical protein
MSLANDGAYGWDAEPHTTLWVLLPLENLACNNGLHQTELCFNTPMSDREYTGETDRLLISRHEGTIEIDCCQQRKYGVNNWATIQTALSPATTLLWLVC